MDNKVRAEVILFSNKFEVIINPECLTSVKNLNIGNIVKRAVTQEIRKITNIGSLNVSSFKRNQELINKKLEELNPRIDEYVGSKHKVLFLRIQYIGLQEKRDKKINELMS